MTKWRTADILKEGGRRDNATSQLSKGGILGAKLSMRIKKIKSATGLRKALQHNIRERIPNNADEKKQDFNFHGCKSSDEAMKYYHKLLPKNVRKNAVHAVEIILQAGKKSEPFEGDQKEFGKKGYKWAEKILGKGNILSIDFHGDEHSGHWHIIGMPIVDGKLNAKKLIGGHSSKLHELQTDCHNDCGKPFGLERGIEKKISKKKHTPHNLAVKFKELEDKMKDLSDKTERRKFVLEQNFSEKELKVFEEEIQGQDYNVEDWVNLLEQKYIQKLKNKEENLKNIYEQNKGLVDIIEVARKNPDTAKTVFININKIMVEKFPNPKERTEAWKYLYEWLPDKFYKSFKAEMKKIADENDKKIKGNKKINTGRG